MIDKDDIIGILLGALFIFNFTLTLLVNLGWMATIINLAVLINLFLHNNREEKRGQRR